MSEATKGRGSRVARNDRLPAGVGLLSVVLAALA